MLALCSLSGSDTQAAYTGKITPPFMNKSSWKQHAYFKKFYRGEQFSVTPVGWIMTSLILCTVGCKRRELYLDLHCSTALASTATRAFVHTCPIVKFFEMEMMLASSTCLTLPAEHWESAITPEGVWCKCGFIRAQRSSANWHKSLKMI